MKIVGTSARRPLYRQALDSSEQKEPGLALFTPTDPGLPRRAFIGFIRVSTQKQGQLGLSLQEQSAAIFAFVNERAGRLIATYGQPATAMGKEAHRNNADLQDAVAAANANEAVLIVTDVSRLGRDEAVADFVKTSGIDVLSIDHGMILKPADVRRGIISAQIEGEALRRRGRTSSTRARRGHGPGNTKNLATVRRDGTIATISKRDALNEHIVEVLRKHDPAATMNAAEVATLLNKRNIRTGRGLEWTRERIRRHLRQARRILAGEL